MYVPCRPLQAEIFSLTCDPVGVDELRENLHRVFEYCLDVAFLVQLRLSQVINTNCVTVGASSHISSISLSKSCS